MGSETMKQSALGPSVTGTGTGEGGERRREGEGAPGEEWEGARRGETDGREGRKSTAPDNGRQRLTTVPN